MEAVRQPIDGDLHNNERSMFQHMRWKSSSGSIKRMT
jgi:hypothetical protein